MVNVGSVVWTAKVEGIADAESKASNFVDTASDTADTLTDTSEAMGGANEKANEMSSGMEEVNTESDRADSKMTFLTGTLWALITTLAGAATSFFSFGGALAFAKTAASLLIRGVMWLVGLLPSMSAIIGGIVGAVKGFVSWMAAGSAGALALAAAIGAAIGLFVVWILHITGVMDWIKRLGQMVGTSLPGWARDGLLAVISIFAGSLAILGGFINGFIEGTMKGGFVQGIRTGFQRAGQVLNVFVGAWERTIGRIVDLAEGAGSAVSEALTGVWNATIPDTVQFPSVTLPSVEVDAGPLGSTTVGGMTVFEGFTFSLPQLQEGGLIEQTGAVMAHAGEMVVPAEVTQNFQQMMSGGGGGGGGGAGTVVDIGTVRIGDQSLDLRNLSRRELQDLVDELAKLVGDDIAARVD